VRTWTPRTRRGSSALRLVLEEEEEAEAEEEEVGAGRKPTSRPRRIRCTAPQ
jgi:hypothetical protein